MTCPSFKTSSLAAPGGVPAQSGALNAPGGGGCTTLHRKSLVKVLPCSLAPQLPLRHEVSSTHHHVSMPTPDACQY